MLVSAVEDYVFQIIYPIFKLILPKAVLLV